jgi:hypothetical protein
MWLTRLIGAAAVLSTLMALALVATASIRLSQNEIGSVMLHAGDTFASVPVAPPACTVDGAGKRCALMLGDRPALLRYALQYPITNRGLEVVSTACTLEVAGRILSCETSWVQHPQRRVAYVRADGVLNATMMTAIQSAWPLENLSEDMWTRIVMPSMALIALTVAIVASRFVLTLRTRIIAAVCFALATFYFSGIAWLIAMAYLVD